MAVKCRRPNLWAYGPQSRWDMSRISLAESERCELFVNFAREKIACTVMSKFRVTEASKKKELYACCSLSLFCDCIATPVFSAETTLVCLLYALARDQRQQCGREPREPFSAFLTVFPLPGLFHLGRISPKKCATSRRRTSMTSSKIKKIKGLWLHPQ